ncbi:MAG: ABC transporter permease, partial [Candidatus Aminicenantes bacterium]
MKEQKVRSPKFFRWILSNLTTYEEFFAISRDFEIEYTEIRQSQGRIKAFLWLLWNTTKVVPYYFILNTKWSATMIKNYLKIAFRNIKRHKGYSFINLAGLSVGMACFILIIFFVQYELGYEKHNPNADKVYRIIVEHQRPEGTYPVGSTPVPLAESLKEEIPEITSFNRFHFLSQTLVTHQDRRFYEQRVALADPGVFDMFGLRMISGQKENALKEIHSAVLADSTAKKYFGSTDPIGQTLLVNNALSIMVKGVIQDYPPNTNFNPDIMISYSTAKTFFGTRYMQNWISQVIHSYIMTTYDLSPADLEGKINQAFKKHIPKDDKRVLKLERLDKLHLFSNVVNTGDIRYIYIFLAAGLLVLLTACINFMNLSTARSARRAKEVGLRKVVGAERRQLIRQFLGESYLYSALSIVLGVGLSFILFPLLRNLTGQSLYFSQLGQTWIILSLLGVVLLVGFCSGSYPALFLSAFQPVNVLKGMLKTGNKGTLFRKVLVVSQFSISIILVISTFIFSRQLRFMNNRDLGFRQDQIIVVRNQGGRGAGNIEPFKQELLKNPSIQDTSGSLMLPGYIGMYNHITWDGAPNDERIVIEHNTVDYDFIETYEMELVAGRNFSPQFQSEIRSGRDRKNAGAVILNETAVKRIGWIDPIGKEIIQTFGTSRIHYKVIGVVKDFHYSSLYNPIQPMKLFLNPRQSRYISVKVQAQDMEETLKYVEAAWNKFKPNYPMSSFFLDSLFADRYQREQRMQSLFGYFSL